MAKASAEAGATHYVAEGDPVPDDLPAGVRLVGPGAPKPKPKPKAKAEAEKAPEPEAEAETPEPPPASAPKATWVDHAVAAGLPPDEAEAMTKAALIEATGRDNGSP